MSNRPQRDVPTSFNKLRAKAASRVPPPGETGRDATFTVTSLPSTWEDSSNRRSGGFHGLCPAMWDTHAHLPSCVCREGVRSLLAERRAQARARPLAQTRARRQPEALFGQPSPVSFLLPTLPNFLTSTSKSTKQSATHSDSHPPTFLPSEYLWSSSLFGLPVPASSTS